VAWMGSPSCAEPLTTASTRSNFSTPSKTRNATTRAPIIAPAHSFALETFVEFEIDLVGKIDSFEGLVLSYCPNGDVTWSHRYPSSWKANRE